MFPLLLIDGYNVIGPVAPPSRGGSTNWLHDERQLLLNRLAEHLTDLIRSRTCVVFDARNPPHGVRDQMLFADMDVRFAVGYAEADDLIEELIFQHPNPKSLTVVSSDHRLHAAAKRKKALPIDSEAWLDALLDGHIQMAKLPKATAKRKRSQPGSPAADDVDSTSQPNDPTLDAMLDADELQKWMDQYGSD
ncbi:NYN domain-containing protein [Rhodopirellula sp. JC740]|uniref:NYN domain-containing protein n=1 Tax=Rhodopirellula halodulae TaxID=2894198 RepID=A0ABS8NCT8_9BACT|nr:NYN domain-containing protein [Rhodopirellula sp. JC740]MCC9641369.1 NYN domain-containing protein [Rhodopirellula sp. JC740]